MPRHKTLVVYALSLITVAILAPACKSKADETPACSNGTKDVGEEGVDCGGTCPEACTGDACKVDGDCASGRCNGTTCAAPSTKTCGVGAPIATCADGATCELDQDCMSGYCDGSKCAEPAAGSHTDGVKNDGETGIDCGGSVKTTQPCPDGQGCNDNTDCTGTCTAGVCGPIGPMDGKKDNGETDVDCGGGVAPACADGKICAMNSDCAEHYCPDATKLCTAPTYTDGVQNGNETDIDCGGTGPGMVTCAQGKNCKVDTDCNGACNYKMLCVDMPSCKNQYGGDTCGGGDTANGQTETHTTSTDANAPGHEDCCRTLPVTGYTDPNQPGKTVYLDKYEITAGRLRAFLEAIGGGSDAVTGGTNPKPANVKAWAATHRPARWNPEWEDVLPQGNTGSQMTYVVKDATTDLLYPGQDIYMSTSPQTFTQNTWWIRGPGPTDTSVQTVGQSATYTVDTGIFQTLNSSTLFPEFYANPADWPPPSEGPFYAEGHALNCSNGASAYGWSTFWFDAATIATNGGVGKAYAESLMDEKSLNCTPDALLAAFCAWDGGQLATAEVMDAITGNTVESAYTLGTQGGKLFAAQGHMQCGNPTYGTAGYNSALDIFNTFSDGTQGCYDVWYYPSDGNNYDDSGKIAMPGRVAADTIRVNATDEPWMDLIGNLQEVVLKKGETERFDYRGFGLEFGSITNHHLQQTTSRFRGGAFGARCMRFK